jgi:hypothetical protein
VTVSTDKIFLPKKKIFLPDQPGIIFGPLPLQVIQLKSGYFISPPAKTRHFFLLA